MLKWIFSAAILAQLLLLPMQSSSKEIIFQAEENGDSSCVWYQGSGSPGLGRMTLSFYNACSKAVFIYVCLTDSLGESQLLKSASRVPAFGRLYLYPFIDRAPAALHWSAARNQPSIPAPCGEDSVPK